MFNISLCVVVDVWDRLFDSVTEHCGHGDETIGLTINCSSFFPATVAKQNSNSEFLIYSNLKTDFV